MRIFKTKLFHKWVTKVGIEDLSLKKAVDEIALKVYDANLGGHLYKKRVGKAGAGKRGSFRTIIAFKKGDSAFFLYGYAKNVRANITLKENKIYKKLAQILFSYNDKQIAHAVKLNELIEVNIDG